MSSNKNAKEKLIRLYGAECFIDKLKLRPERDRRYTGKGQMKKMQQLTYHHIQEKSKGGKATVENGAILSLENHIWFNEQTPEVQRELNRRFQEYKKCGVVFVEDLSLGFEVKAVVIEPPTKEEKPKRKFNRAKAKRETQELIDDDLCL